MAELADALVLGTSGQPCRFKSCCPHCFLWLSMGCRGEPFFVGNKHRILEMSAETYQGRVSVKGIRIS